MPNTMDPRQRYMFLALPFIFVIFVIRFPVGLMLYWITTNLWTVGQQFVLRKLMPPPVHAPAAKAVKGGPAKGGGSAKGAGGAKGGGGTPKGGHRSCQGQRRRRQLERPQHGQAAPAVAVPQASHERGRRVGLGRGNRRHRRRGSLGGAARARAPARDGRPVRRRDRRDLRGRTRTARCGEGASARARACRRAPRSSAPATVAVSRSRWSPIPT